MSLKYYKPITPGQRHKITIDFKKDKVWRGSSLKNLLLKKKKTGGRNNKGQISSYHRGGGYKHLIRNVDLKRNLKDVSGIIKRIEYDPNRTSYIMLVVYENGKINYILASDGFKVGDKIISSDNPNTDIQIGNSLPLKNIPIGTIIHNIELYPKKGGQIARSAGTYAKLIKRDKKYSLVRLISGKHLNILNSCFATIGVLSNSNLKNKNNGKAGYSRWIGIKPTVRGVAMNPVDHPHGGGEGKTSGGRCSVTPWGLPTKGFKTKRKKKR